jgi:hypothetical protein
MSNNMGGMAQTVRLKIWSASPPPPYLPLFRLFRIITIIPGAKIIIPFHSTGYK